MTQDQLYNKLKQAYPKAVQLNVTDLTGTQDHYSVEIQSPEFTGLSRIEQHQHVMRVLSEELASGELHALQLKTKPV